MKPTMPFATRGGTYTHSGDALTAASDKPATAAPAADETATAPSKSQARAPRVVAPTKAKQSSTTKARK